MAFPFDLSQTLPIGGGLLVACSLPGSPVIKHLVQMLTTVHGLWVGSLSVLPLTTTCNPSSSVGQRCVSRLLRGGLVRRE